MSSGGAEAAGCPVDHEARQAWLDQAKKARSQDAPPPPPQATPSPPIPNNIPHDLRQIPIQTRYSLDHGAWLAVLPKNMSMMSPAQRGALDTFREISTIPRAGTAEGHDAAATTHSPANNEQESGVDEKSGNWVYPSEEMFFNAMKRKNYDPEAADMRTIVPIHNAVNEQAWKEIKAWEKGRGSEACGGPRLVSFMGQSKELTPRARFNSILGYSKPFDRHDWIVDRCGTHIDYVIDFYAGKNEGKPGKSLNFYLDVRPKLNSWEGVKMRVEKFWGL
ncbi:cytochrome c1 heme lyase-like protein [Aureobasidium pullulans]|nr:cytochrome c1 heme lyase-like protein [Aureobasidium pullulans]THW44100.1 cytochrome c1 heme lyase-like protein [Aureobasidium pullulans]THW45342.1 cytochrome c1 heme lyase-like protein [Aureobasidium pullulans]THW69436.1 cytochrome c1 heme lyase-like protein [Aureobasidium pullulans]THW76741.1 cytochrome c1 heme lyase-like protein [Aureobasidium pullulans]